MKFSGTFWCNLETVQLAGVVAVGEVQFLETKKETIPSV